MLPWAIQVQSIIVVKTVMHSQSAIVFCSSDQLPDVALGGIKVLTWYAPPVLYDIQKYHLQSVP